MAKRVLVLDDDPGFRQALERELQRLGHEPASFAGWAEALDHVERAAALDSVVIELALSHGPNGVSFARLARRRRPDVRLAFITGSQELAANVDPRLGPVFLKSEGAERIAQSV